jgi:hypothetical protein
MDGGLMRVLRGGIAALPEDLFRLRDYLMMTNDLLAEKAQEVETNWALACAAAAEIETLQRLEALVVEKAAAVPAGSFRDVLAKLDIWEALGPSEAETECGPQRDRLVQSARADIERLLAMHRVS